MAEKSKAALLGNTMSQFLSKGDGDDVYHTIKFLEDVPMILNVEIGRCDMSIKEILTLKKGSVVEFSKIVGEPMDVLVAERLMARGEVVVVNERYGVRISEVTRPDEKVGDRSD